MEQSVETAIDIIERIIRATSTLTGRPVEQLVECWNSAMKINGYAFSPALIDFLAANFKPLIIEAESEADYECT